MKCPICSKKMEFFEEESNLQQFTCKWCEIFVDIEKITDKEILKIIKE